MKLSLLLPVEVWLDELARQIERLRASIDAESVHRLRVSAGRLSVWLELGARRALRDDLRSLRRAAAVVRDLDVLSASQGSSEWAALLAAERGAEAARLRAALASPRVDALVEALSLVPGPDPVAVRAAVQRLKRRVQRAGDRLGEEPERARALHRLRRRVRRLRYALDWLGSETRELRDLQEALGALNDLSVERERLAASGAEHPLAARRVAVEAEMDTARARALEAWHALRPRVGDL